MLRYLLLLALLAASALASACGYCLEDKIAAVYDHAVVTRAAAQGHQVAFFHLDGTTRRTPRAIAQVVQSAECVDRGSARVSRDATTLAVAYDPRRNSFAVVQATLEKRLAGMQLSLVPLQVLP